jgi:hypothetical protein
VLFILGWTPRGSATASATALLGPRLDSSMLWKGPSHCCPPWGRYMHGGVVFIIIVHLEWGSSAWGQTSNTFTLIKRRAWVLEGPGSPLFCFMLSLELGAPRLAYRYALAASTLVDSPRCEFFKFVLARWWQGKFLQLPKKE